MVFWKTKYKQNIVKNQEKEAGTNLILLSQWRNMIDNSLRFIYLDQAEWCMIFLQVTSENDS